MLGTNVAQIVIVKHGKILPFVKGSDKPCNAPHTSTQQHQQLSIHAPPAPVAPAVTILVCPNGCTAPTELTGNCDSLEKDANGNYYKNCPYECTGKGCQYDQQCSNCGAFKITGLWDKNGNYIGQDENVQKIAASNVAGGTRTVGTPDGTLDADTADAYNQAGGTISTPSAV